MGFCDSQHMALGVACLSVLLLYPMDPGVTVGDFVPGEYTPETLKPANTDMYDVEDHYFWSHDEKCHAWLYLPLAPKEDDEEEQNLDETEEKESSAAATTQPPPVIIMANGIGAQKDFGPTRYAEEFARSGMAVLIFDYRNFGPSTGTPRNLISPKRHIQDWHAAIDYVERNITKDVVNEQQIGLWGTSFAGGHVLMVASERNNNKKNDNIVSIVSQVPHLNGKLASKIGMKKRGVIGTIRSGLAAIQDILRSYIGLSPVCVKVCGTGWSMEGWMAIMEVPLEEYWKYLRKQPYVKLGSWKNQAPARIFLELRFYNPIETIAAITGQIETPVLLIGAQNDDVCPPKLIEEVSHHLPSSRVITRDSTHFEIYTDPHFNPLIEEMVQFYQHNFGIPKKDH